MVSPQPFRLLVQYVPHMYGWKGMNVPFCLWLWGWQKPKPWVMFHEVAFPCARTQSLAHNALGVVTHAMAVLMARAARKIFVSIPQCVPLVRRLAPGTPPAAWLPIPSNVATDTDPAAVAAVRERLAPENGIILGHFGTFGPLVVDGLLTAIPALLQRHPHVTALLVGRGSDAFAERLRVLAPVVASRIRPTGELSADGVAAHLAASDLLIQPYPDGVSSRRTSLMAGLALGRPIVTTRGWATEPVWDHDALVALAGAGDLPGLVALTEALLGDAEARRRLGLRARLGYERYFNLQRTIQTLRDAT